MNILDRLYDKLVKPIEDASAARGYANGRAKGIAEVFDWAARKADAEAKGIPFYEPRPQPAPLTNRRCNPSRRRPRSPMPVSQP